MTRLAAPPKHMDAIQQLIWDKHESDPERFSLSAMSKAAGMGHAYMQQFLHRGTPRRLPEDVRKKLARFLGVPESRLRPPDILGITSEGHTTMDEGELVPRDKAPKRLAALLEPGLELWRMTQNQVALGGFSVGDYVLVDLSVRRPGSYVLATIGKQHVFRLYLPPHLFVSRDTSLELSETADGVSVVVRGAIVGRYGDME
jgi:hypothetical protein